MWESSKESPLTLEVNGASSHIPSHPRPAANLTLPLCYHRQTFITYIFFFFFWLFMFLEENIECCLPFEMLIEPAVRIKSLKLVENESHFFELDRLTSFFFFFWSNQSMSPSNSFDMMKQFNFEPLTLCCNQLSSNQPTFFFFSFSFSFSFSFFVLVFRRFRRLGIIASNNLQHIVVAIWKET